MSPLQRMRDERLQDISLVIRGPQQGNEGRPPFIQTTPARMRCLLAVRPSCCNRGTVLGRQMNMEERNGKPPPTAALYWNR
jgi:hypothetical protein